MKEGKQKIYFYHEPAFDFEDERAAILMPIEVADDLSSEQTYRLFRQMNCYKYLAYMENKEEEKADLSFGASRCRNTIATHNLGLVRKVAVKLRPFESWDSNLMAEMLSEGQFWFLRAIDCFDYRQHSKFSAYASLSVVRRIIIYLDEMREAPNQIPDDFDPIAQDSRRWSDIKLGMESVREMIRRHAMTDPEKRIMELRLGLVDGEMWSFCKIGEKMNCSWHNVRRKFTRLCREVFGKTLSEEK